MNPLCRSYVTHQFVNPHFQSDKQKYRNISTSAMETIYSAEPKISLTVQITGHIDAIIQKDGVDRVLVKELKEYRSEEAIPFRLVKGIHDVLSESGEKCYLHELLQGSEVVLRKPPVIPRNPELEERCKRLRAQQANRDYKEMTRNVDKNLQEKDYFRPGQELKEINRQIISVVNFVVTVGGAFAFGYKAMQYGFEGQSNVFALQMIAGLSLATLVFFADLYFLVRESR